MAAAPSLSPQTPGDRTPAPSPPGIGATTSPGPLPTDSTPSASAPPPSIPLVLPDAPCTDPYAVGRTADGRLALCLPQHRLGLRWKIV